MSDRPTPETDDIARGNHVVPTEWAQNLERQRDFWREKYATEATEHMLSINKICNERDEWKAKYIQQNKDLSCEMMDPNGTIWDYAKKVQTEITAVTKERDEARAVADELSAIAARYLGWHLSRTPMGPDDDHFAQSRRISETLARWKSLASA